MNTGTVTSRSKPKKGVRPQNLLLPIFFTLVAMVHVPHLAQAASQHPKVVEAESQIQNKNLGTGDIFDSEISRSSSLKGNRLDQEDVDQLVKEVISGISGAYDEVVAAKSGEEMGEHPEGGPSRPKVTSQLPLTEAYEPWYDTISLGYAWIGGFRPYLYWANTTNCFHRISNMTYHEIPEF